MDLRLSDLDYWWVKACFAQFAPQHLIRTGVLPDLPVYFRHVKWRQMRRPLACNGRTCLDSTLVWDILTNFEYTFHLSPRPGADGAGDLCGASTTFSRQLLGWQELSAVGHRADAVGTLSLSNRRLQLRSRPWRLDVISPTAPDQFFGRPRKRGIRLSGGRTPRLERVGRNLCRLPSLPALGALA